VVTLALPDRSGSAPIAEEMDVEQMLQRLHRALDRLEPKKVVLHLPLPTPAPAPAAASAQTA
jgi:hypothetical protein